MKHVFTDYLLILLAQFPAIRCDGTAIDELKNRLVDLNEAAIDIQNRADAEDRSLTDDESDEIDGILAQFKDTEKQIARREKIAAHSQMLSEPKDRQSEPTNSAKSRQPRVYQTPKDPKAEGRFGFRNFGEFALAVKNGSARNNPNIDQRLIQNAPTTVSTEGSGADGGFAVPPEFRQEITRLVMGEDSVIGRTDQLFTGGNFMVLPKDETTPWQNSGGIQAYWEGENSQLTQSKVALEQDSIRLNKLTTLVPVTEELLSDASGIDSYLRSKVPEKMDYKIHEALINGNGAGKPTGVLESGALVTVAKESGQAADTVVYDNIVKMWSRMYGPARRNAVWMINQDIEPQLFKMSFEGTSSSVPAYMPAGGLSGAPYGTLMGRPVIESQACKTLGDLGDIILVDWSKYRTIQKTEGMRSDVSMHLWFDYDTLAYRFIIRLAGNGWYSSPITPANGSNTLSPFVALAARA